MDIKQCPNCQKQFDQDKRVSKQLPCGCISCLKCFKYIYYFTKEIKCANHQKTYNINPEELKGYNAQEQDQKWLVDQVQINECFRWLQGQYAQKQKYYLMLREVIQGSVQFMKHIQELSMHLMFKTQVDQFSLSNNKIEKLLKRLAEFQVANEAQQYQVLRVSQQNPRLSSNCQSQLQQQLQQILREIDELKKDQWMDVQSLRVNIQRCMFCMFAYLSENSSGHLLTDREAELLVQNYFKQIKVQNILSQVSNSVVQQKSSLQSQHNIQSLSQESQRIQQQQQNQVIDKQQGQNIVQDEQLLVSKETSLQERQIIDERLMFQQLEQKSLNLTNNFSFNNQVNQLCQEQKSLIKYVIQDFVDIRFDKLVQFLRQIKEERVSLQVLQFSPLNKSGLIEKVQILLQLPQLTDQKICLKLNQIITSCKSQQVVSQIAANSITMLNYMNFAFTNQDFQSLDLAKSDLSDTTFTNCNFSNSSLTQANLRNSKFINCDLSNSNLTSIITEHPHIFTGHTDHAFSISISSDSELIVSGSRDNTVRLWNVKTGNSQTMSGHTSSVLSVAISSDSELIVSGSGDKTVKI